MREICELLLFWGGLDVSTTRMDNQIDTKLMFFFVFHGTTLIPQCVLMTPAAPSPRELLSSL